ncbi:hypothetical protein HN51_069335, partial [Arachis hypogaea]
LRRGLYKIKLRQLKVATGNAISQQQRHDLAREAQMARIHGGRHDHIELGISATVPNWER